MSLSKVDKSISVIRYLLKKKKKRVDEMLSRSDLNENQKIFIGQETELIQNVEVLITAFQDTINANLGKMPPQDTALEESVLGAIILEGQIVSKVVGFLKPEHFYREEHRIIYQAVLDTLPNVVDMRLIVDIIRKKGLLQDIGGAPKIAEVTMKVSSTVNIIQHARILVEMSVKRELILIGVQLCSDGYDDTKDFSVMLDYAVEQLNRINAWVKK